jgi:hypothetical protein
MNRYLVKFNRQIPTEIKFEVEANNPVKALEEARIQFEDIDWSLIDESDTRWKVCSIKKLKTEAKQ